MTTNQTLRLTDGRIRTNPVLCFEDWLQTHFRADNAPASRAEAAKKIREWGEAGVVVPSHALEILKFRGWLPEDVANGDWRSPRVVGLLFDGEQGVGLVNPLITKCSAHWQSSALLPFFPSAVQSLFLRVCEHIAPQIPGALPEAFGFEFDECLHESGNGRSMDVSALLSALDTVTGHECDIFAAACAVVEEGSKGTLISVSRVTEKLEAFVREYQRATLLVVSPDCQLDERLRSAFDTVWNVASIADLAKELGRIPQIGVRLSHAQPVGTGQIGLLLSRLRFLDEQDDYPAVIQLCERIAMIGFSEQARLHDKLRIEKYHFDSLRHLGKYKDSLRVAAETQRLLEQFAAFISSDEQMGHACDTAAALFDACDFRGAFQLLQPWLDRCHQDPQRFSGQKRVELFNTIGRSLVMLKSDGWEELFNRSAEIQSCIDPTNIRWTESFLIDGLLKTDRLIEAESLISRHESSPTDNPLANGFTKFYRCDLERRKGALWPDRNDELPAGRGYTHAFALQAAARQPGREASQAADWLERSEDELHRECDSRHNILIFIASALSLRRAAITGDRQLWSESIRRLATYIHDLGEAPQSYFCDTMIGLGDEPSVTAAENLIRLVPYL